MTATTSGSLTTHRAVMQAAGPQAVAEIAADLTAEHIARCDTILARTTALSDELFAYYMGVPAEMGAELRRILTVGGTK